MHKCYNITVSRLIRSTEKRNFDYMFGSTLTRQDLISTADPGIFQDLLKLDYHAAIDVLSKFTVV